LRLDDGQGLTPDSHTDVHAMGTALRVRGNGQTPRHGPRTIPARYASGRSHLTETTRAQLLLGTDPLEHRRRNVEAERERSKANARGPRRGYLETVAREHHKRIGKQFRNAKHAAQWLSHR